MGSYYLTLVVYTAAIAVSIMNDQSYASLTVFNVMSFGAKPDGLRDNSKAFVDAWSAACGSHSPTNVIRVPKGRFLLHPVTFSGQCNSSNVIFQNGGTLVAPMDYRILGKSENWLSFDGVSGVSVVGGALDAKGAKLWACKATGKTCPDGATSLSFMGSSKIVVKNVLSLNSQMFHIVINRCQDVHVEGVKIVAPGESPNTDGIHVQLSENVAIYKSSIKTGDDCVSIGPGTKNLWIEGVTCGPGHGISIGSLGKDLEEEGVQNVTVRKVVFNGADNGLRIKSWAKPSKGFVQRVRFLGAIMRNVKNPLVIDQNYCPNNDCTDTHESGVKISDVLYQGIRGTSATEIAISIECSSANPCRGITLQDVNLSYPDHAARSLCTNAIGNTIGTVNPSNCL